MRRVLHWVLLAALASAVLAGPGQARESRAHRLARAYAAATVDAAREMGALAPVVRRYTGYRRRAALRGCPRGRDHRARHRLIADATFAISVTHGLDPALPALQRFVDRLVFAGRGDRVLVAGARAWLRVYRFYGHLPWVPLHVCRAIRVWKAHHFAARWAPIGNRALRRYNDPGFPIDRFANPDQPIGRAAARLRRLGLSRRVARQFDGGILDLALFIPVR